MTGKIRSPAKILVGLRFRNRCKLCKKEIPSPRIFCDNCIKKLKSSKKLSKKFQAFEWFDNF